jgi:hypothetical protein
MCGITDWVASRKAVFDAVRNRTDSYQFSDDDARKCTDAALYAYDNGESGAIAAMVGQTCAETIRKEHAASNQN